MRSVIGSLEDGVNLIMSELVFSNPHSPDQMKSYLPMYDLLVSNLTERMNSQPYSIGPDYVAKLAAIINSLTPDQAEQVALLLIHNYFLMNPAGPNPFVSKVTGRGTGHHLPYDIKMSSGKGFSFDLASLQIQLQALIGTFCSL